MKRILALSVAACLCAILAQGQTPRAGTGRYDAEIEQAVTKLLASKDKWKGIKASTDDGIVTLEGTVRVLIEKLDAAKKVDKVAHVGGVRNHVEVEGNVSDHELEQKLADKLRYDRVGYGIVFNALGLRVENGVVTVTGDVRDYPSRDSALAIVETTPGVKEVMDEINVLPVSAFDDDIRIRVARAIYGNSALSKYALDPEKPIRIVVDNGRVTLYGVVDSKLTSRLHIPRPDPCPTYSASTTSWL